MKRFQVHAHVTDQAAGVAFCTRLSGAAPTRQEADYAKWMPDDPRLNFAISTRGSTPGVDQLGIQVDDEAELAALKARAEAAHRGALLDEGATSCCHARSEKHWVTDPQGIAREHFRTLADIPVFRVARAGAGACCTPGQPVQPSRGGPVAVPVVAAGGGCC